MIKKSSVIALSFMALIASGDQTEFKLLDNEYWWGGHSFKGRSMPYSAEKSFKDNLINNNSYNQTSGLLLSSKGRWLWNDEPFSFEFTNGVFKAKDTGNGKFVMGSASDATLRGAFREASKRFFPADGKMPDEPILTHCS